MSDLPFDLQEAPVEVVPSDDDILTGLKEALGIRTPDQITQDVLEVAGLPKIQGHQLTYKEWHAFQEYVLHPNKLDDVAAAVGITRKALYNYRKENWWAELFNIHVAERQQDLHAGMLRKTEDALTAFENILQGNLDAKEEGRYANAMAKGIDLLTKLGKNPLQDNRSLTNIDNRTLINTGTVHLTREKLETLDQDDMLKMITGEVKIEGV